MAAVNLSEFLSVGKNCCYRFKICIHHVFARFGVDDAVAEYDQFAAVCNGNVKASDVGNHIPVNYQVAHCAARTAST